MKRIGALATLTLLGSAAFMLTTASPAAAQEVCVYEGADKACLDTGTRVARVCDNEADGNGVYGWFGGDRYLWDANGSAGGCSYKSYPTASSVQVCEDVYPGMFLDPCSGD
ncbi:hypothetical protein [Actinomadura rugatobispora]|uniref:Secreted protein n=1 Tax=Actinomadura rugatobispora TaxID=1994 RepID=A0ABW0ZV06_9ACTN|nr:hypothetical protein GCM10010200_035630 [Actinomadura rugatobispora]